MSILSMVMADPNVSHAFKRAVYFAEYPRLGVPATEREPDEFDAAQARAERRELADEAADRRSEYRS